VWIRVRRGEKTRPPLLDREQMVACTFIRSFVRSLVRSLVRSFVRSLARSAVHPFVRSFIVLSLYYLNSNSCLPRLPAREFVAPTVTITVAAATAAAAAAAAAAVAVVAVAIIAVNSCLCRD